MRPTISPERFFISSCWHQSWWSRHPQREEGMTHKRYFEHGDAHHIFGISGQDFDILGQAPEIAQPGEGAFDNPAPGQDGKAILDVSRQCRSWVRYFFTCVRCCRFNSSSTCSQTPCKFLRRKWSYTVFHGGKSFGNMRHWQPLFTTYSTALTIACLLCFGVLPPTPLD